MTRKEKIQRLLSRLEDLQAENPVGSVERLLKEEEDKTRTNAGISGTSTALKVLAKGVEKAQAAAPTEKLRKSLEEVDSKHQATAEGLASSFSEQINALLEELRVSSDTGAQMTQEGIQSVLERFAEYEGTFQEGMQGLQNMDSLLEAEVNRVSQEIEVIYGRLAEVPDHAPSIQRIEVLFTESVAKTATDATQALIDLETRLEKRLNQMSQNRSGGNQNRNIAIGGNPSVLSPFTDINLKAGNNVTLTVVKNQTTKYMDVTIAATGGGGGSVTGIIRSVNNVAGNTAAGDTAGTDYVYLVGATANITLPTSVNNNNLYTIKNVGAGTVTILPTGAETIEGAANITMPVQYTSVDLISNNSGNWNIS